MSAWWAKRDQLDADQIQLIEKLALRESFMILGPPGSGKTNVLLRRAQFVRSLKMPNVVVLTFTRPLTEFVKTGCVDAAQREIFPTSAVDTIETWLRQMYKRHGARLPGQTGDLVDWKRKLASGAMSFAKQGLHPRYDAIFVDEAQDLIEEEVSLMREWSDVLFFVGDDRQKIFNQANGLSAIRSFIKPTHERALTFHYRVAPDICKVADRILTTKDGNGLAATSHYNGPTPATVSIPAGRMTRDAQLARVADRLRDQIRVFGDLIQQGDRLGVIVARKEDRDAVFEHLERDADLKGKSKIIRSKDEGGGYDPSFASQEPICILTVAGCKGLEFRAVHWLFADELSHHHNSEHYYTVVTRAKTSLDITHTEFLPDVLARAHAEGMVPW